VREEREEKILIHPPVNSKRGVGFAHSKIILIGEHAVVYGKPAIALPFPKLSAKVEVLEEKGDVYIENERFSGLMAHMPTEMEGLKACIKETFRTFQREPKDIKIVIQSDIPMGKGLGSSAAIAVALVKAMYSYFKKSANYDEMMRLVEVAETFAHGTPSGIDMAATSWDDPIWFMKGKKPEPIEIGKEFYLVVADTGRVGKTRQAVEGIREILKTNGDKAKAALETLGSYSFKARECLRNGDIKLLGSLLDLAQKELDNLGVSDDGINHLVRIAKLAGAFGAKLTGGGRGGCIIAISAAKEKAEEICRQLKENGAEATWYIEVKKNIFS